MGPAWVPDAVLGGFGLGFGLGPGGFWVCPSAARMQVSSFKYSVARSVKLLGSSIVIIASTSL